MGAGDELMYNRATVQSLQVAAVAAVVNDCKRMSSIHRTNFSGGHGAQPVSVKVQSEEKLELAVDCFVRRGSADANGFRVPPLSRCCIVEHDLALINSSSPLELPRTPTRSTTAVETKEE